LEAFPEENIGDAAVLGIVPSSNRFLPRRAHGRRIFPGKALSLPQTLDDFVDERYVVIFTVLAFSVLVLICGAESEKGK
jgi:hypothetical protein